MSYWILLTNIYMADTFIAPEVNSYRYVISPNEKLKKGDTVYLWLSYDPCFYGLGTVADLGDHLKTGHT